MVYSIYLAFVAVFTFVYFLTFMLLKQGLKNLRKNQNRNQNKEYKSVSVVVSARNEQKNLPGLFSALEEQNTDGIVVEFIIIDDRSEDKTGEILEGQAAKDPRFKIITIKDKIPGFAPKKRAIDLAISQSGSDIILLTDADGRPGPLWIKSYLDLFNCGADMVIGYAPYKIAREASLAQKMLALEYFSHASIAAATTGLEFPLTCVGTNMAYLKNVYREIDGFGEYKSFISGDDDLFLTRVRESKKYRIDYNCSAESQVWNAPPSSFKKFVNQRLRYASKGFNYPFKVTIVLALYVIYNFLLFAGPAAGQLLDIRILIVALLALLVKMLTEFFFVQQAAKLLNDRRFVYLYFLTSLLHMPYVLFFGVAGQLKIFKWAEQKAEYGITREQAR
ncbi:MAG: glycosyltransferase [Calditrichae bacterium]|nr:glycosyltransferase [Calditrichota bacterium]MCB9058843.1 glycosyltransferase [Calditrichia bacterium]